MLYNKYLEKLAQIHDWSTINTLNKNHPVEDGASVETDATSDGDKIDNSLLDLKVIPLLILLLIV
jgi:predicted alpha-1,6-mannanase (GH76 family)